MGLCNSAALIFSLGRSLRFCDDVSFAAKGGAGSLSFFFLPDRGFVALWGPGVSPCRANLGMCKKKDDLNQIASMKLRNLPTLARRGIPSILDHVFGSSRKKFRDLTPSDCKNARFSHLNNNLLFHVASIYKKRTGFLASAGSQT